MLGARLAALGFAKKFNPLQLFQKGAVGAWYDPSTLWGAADHLPRRNLFAYTEDLTNATYWASGRVTVTANSTTAPDGTTTADTMAANTDSASGAWVRQTIANAVAGTTYVLSISIKAGTINWCRIRVNDTSANFKGFYINLATGAKGAEQNVGSVFTVNSSSIVRDSGTGWCRVTLNVTTTASGTFGFDVYTAQSDNSITCTTGDSIIVWGAQLSLASTTDQSYQRVTDWTTELYAHAAAKNVPWLRRNRFLNTATLSTQTVSAVTATPLTVSFTGTGTITFSTAYVGTLVGTGASDRVTATFTPTAGNLVCTVTGSVTLAQCEVGSAATAYQAVGASWEAQYAANAAAAGVALTMYQDSAGTTPVTGPDSIVGKLNDLSGLGYHAVQTGATGLKPALRLCPNGCWYIQRDLTDDALVTTFPNLGTSCVSYINNGSTVTETTGVTLNGALTQNTPAADYGRIYLNAPSAKSAQIIKWLKAKAGL